MSREKEFESRIINIVDKKVAEAKADISEARLKLTIYIIGALLTLFGFAGILYPLWQTSQTTDRVDKAISDMKSEFKEIVGIQNRRPDLRCFYNGEDIEDKTIILNVNSLDKKYFKIENVGDAVATNIKVQFYLKIPDGTKFIQDQNFFSYWDRMERYDEKEYNSAMELGEKYQLLDPEDKFYFSIDYHYKKNELIDMPAMIIIYYGQPELTKIKFTIRSVHKETKKK